MRPLVWTFVGSIFFIDAVAAQDAQKGRQGPVAAVQQPAVSDALPPGAIARLGAAARQDRMPGYRPGTALVYSPDGSVVAMVDNEVRLWDDATGREVRTLTRAVAGPAAAAAGFAAAPDMSRLTAVAFAPDGKTIAAMNAMNVAVWETATGRPVTAWPMTGNARIVPGNIGLAYTPDGKALVTVVYNVQAARAAGGVLNRGLALIFWDVATGKELRQIPLADVNSPSGTVIAISPDGRTVAAAIAGQAIHVIELATGKVRDELTPDRPTARGRGRFPPGVVTRDPQGVRFAPDGRTLYMVSGEGEIVAHDLVTGQERRFGAAQPGSPLLLSVDGKSLAVRAVTTGVRVYDAVTGRLRQRVHETGFTGRPVIGPFALSPDGATVAIHDGLTMHFADVATGRDRVFGSGHSAPISGLSFGPDGRTLISTGGDQVITWDVGRRAVAATRPMDEDRVPVRAVSPNGKTMAEALFDGHLRLTELATGQSRELQAGPRVSALAFAPDGKVLVAVEFGSVPPDGDPRPIRRWDVATGAPQPSFEPGAARSTRLCFSQDGRRLAASDFASGARVWEWPSGRLLWQAPPRAGAINPAGPVALSPDGRKLALAGQGPVHLFDAATGQAAGELEGHAGATQSVAFAPDGRTLATGGTDGLVRIWDVETGAPIHNLAGHVGNVPALAYSSDGALLASGGTDASIILWDATKLGRPAAPMATAAPELTAEQIKKCWDDLAAPDAKVAFKAVRMLAASPVVSVPRLQELLTPVPAPDSARVAELLADLDHNQYARRQKASESLAALGTVVRSALEQHRPTAPAEARQRIDDLLRRLDQTEWTPEMLRQARAVEALERAGTPDAKAVLEKLAQGAADALVTREARAALGRMK
jgi:WD40 repeat protein